jgi:hypothetical protein
MSKRPRILMLTWDGEVFRPLPSFMPYINREYEKGELYHLGPIEERSQASHNQYFAAVAEGFQNLNEESAKHFPGSEFLRKWALVQCGYCTETYYDMKNNAEALKLATTLRRHDEHLIIKVRDNVVQVFEAESQSKANMKKGIFEQSKRDVLDLIASMSRTTRSQLNNEARRHGR